MSQSLAASYGPDDNFKAGSAASVTNVNPPFGITGSAAVSAGDPSYAGTDRVLSDSSSLSPRRLRCWCFGSR